ncbi:MAG: Ig-like domain-containing protein, partial [Oscillospiraceae bacterium]|nr:Ig-like domain-containing protein [Oscillospiraceae bacterium]
MKRIMKRLLSGILALVMLLICFPAPPARAGQIESDWVLESELPAGAKVIESKWVTEQIKTRTSNSNVETEGWHIVDTKWEETPQPDRYTALSIPTGFKKDYWLYEELSKPKPNYVSTESVKYVETVSSGYIYWHWMYDCGGANGWEYRAIRHAPGTGEDNGCYYQYFGAFWSDNGNYSSDRYYCNSRNITNYIIPEKWHNKDCQGATRWFRFDAQLVHTVKKTATFYLQIETTEEYNTEAEIPEDGPDPNDPKNTLKVISKKHYVTYLITTPDLPAPQANFPSDSHIEPDDKITLHCANPNSTIYYKITSTNHATQYQEYTEPIQVLDEDHFTVAAYAKSKDTTQFGDSDEAVFVYHVGYLDDLPTVTTHPAAQIDDTSAFLSCSVESDSSIIGMEFRIFDKTEQIKHTTVKADIDGSTGTTLLTDLEPGTQYLFLAAATNVDGGLNLGNVQSFRTTGESVLSPRTVTVTPAYAIVKPGTTRTLTAVVLPAQAEQDVIWSSSDESIATVDAKTGMVTAVGVGLVKITATTVLGQKQDSCMVDVYPYSDIQGKFDFSEYNMMMSCSSKNETDGFDRSAISGGNSQTAVAYLARWGGVLEENDPYPIDARENYHRLDADFHVQEILYLPWRTGPLDNGEIKNAVLKYGAVYAALHTAPEFRSDHDTNFYLPPGYSGAAGHAVAIIGWDDNYSASHFSMRPAGDGAFICKNSWGPEHGEGGFCYVSYYDTTLATSVTDDVPTVFYHAQTTDNYDKIYQYDELGAVAKYKYDAESGWFANVFPRKGECLSADEMLSAVSFYTVAPATSYALYVIPDYKGPNSLTALGDPIKQDMIDYAGYHTIRLTKPIRLSAGTRFAVVVKITPANGDAITFMEAPRIGVSSQARAGAEESFVRGEKGSWTELRLLREDANVCLKAFTVGNEEPVTMLLDAQEQATEERNYTEEELAAMSTDLNPAFLLAIKNAEENGEESYGLIPPSVLPDVEQSFSYDEGTVFLARYDLRDEGLVTEARTQQPFPACWAFAACASLESCALRASKSNLELVGGLNQAGEDEISVLFDLNTTILDLSPGQSTQLPTIVYPYDSSTALFWESSDPSVASVSQRGAVLAKSYGTVEIRVTTEDGASTAACTVQVTAPQPVESLSLSCTADPLPIGQSALMEVSIYPRSLEAHELVWSSDNPSAVTVDEYGVIT